MREGRGVVWGGSLLPGRCTKFEDLQIFLRQPGKDGEARGLVGGVGRRRTGHGQRVNVGAEGATPGGVHGRASSRVETGSACGRRGHVIATATGHHVVAVVAAGGRRSVEVVVQLLHGALHVGGECVGKVPSR